MSILIFGYSCLCVHHRAGDEILAVNGTPLQGLSHAEAIAVFKSIRNGHVVVHAARRDTANRRYAPQSTISQLRSVPNFPLRVYYLLPPDPTWQSITRIHRFIYLFPFPFVLLLLWTEANPSRVMNSTASNDNGNERENGGTVASQRNFTLRWKTV